MRERGTFYRVALRPRVERDKAIRDDVPHQLEASCPKPAGDEKGRQETPTLDTGGTREKHQSVEPVADPRSNMHESAISLRIRDEILYLKDLVKVHGTGRDKDGVEWSDKIKVLEQLIKTIDSMEARGELE